MIQYFVGPTTTSGGGVGRRRREIYDLNDRDDESIYYQNPSSELTDKDTTLDESSSPDFSMQSYMRTESPTTTASMLPSDRNAVADVPESAQSAQSAENDDASDEAEHTVDVELTNFNIQDKIAKNLLAADGETRAGKKVTFLLTILSYGEVKPSLTN